MTTRVILGLAFIICYDPSKAQNSSEIDFDDSFIVRHEIDNLPGLLSGTMGLYARTAAFDFSHAFFRDRGLDRQQLRVLLNNVIMNKMDNGRPDWNNWGGLNDALRNKEYSMGLNSGKFLLGGLGGIVNINSYASLYPKGIKGSLALSNKTYASRLMLTYTSGWNRGLKYQISSSARLSNQGYREGSAYESYSFLASFDWRLNSQNLINATLIYAKIQKGMSSPVTEEVFELKGDRYNAYWGFHDTRMRNSRIRTIEEPIVQLNYRYDKEGKTNINVHLTCQFGNRSTSRIDFGGSRILPGSGLAVGGGYNPDPTYYQKLPSYYLRNTMRPDYTGAYLARERFMSNGQIDWLEMIQANKNALSAGNSIYAQYEDRADELSMTFQADGSRQLSSKLQISASIFSRYLSSNRFARMLDLLGGSQFLDVDPYDDNSVSRQSDLRNPNRTVGPGDRFKYHYRISANDFSLFLRADYQRKNQDYYLALELGRRSFQRTGHYENGSYPGRASLGKGDPLSFESLGMKIGFIHKFDGRNLLSLAAAYLLDPPGIRDSYVNIRESNQAVMGLGSEIHHGFDLSYHVRMPRFQGVLTGYFSESNSGNRISFYYADGLTGLENTESSAFIHEILSGIGRRSFGVQASMRFDVLESFRIKGVLSVGDARYSSSPSLYITSDDQITPIDFGPSHLKGYRLPNGPQHAFSLGFEYSDPDYWWTSVSFNHFDHSYIQLAPLTRTKNFMTDHDGLQISSFDPLLARQLLKQEKFKAYSILNIVGGKSWKIKKTIIGFFVSVNNVLNQPSVTGGYEQSRNANFKTLLEDKNRPLPLFGPKYWYGYGMTFFSSIYVKFR